MEEAEEISYEEMEMASHKKKQGKTNARWYATDVGVTVGRLDLQEGQFQSPLWTTSRYQCHVSD